MSFFLNIEIIFLFVGRLHQWRHKSEFIDCIGKWGSEVTVWEWSVIRGSVHDGLPRKILRFYDYPTIFDNLAKPLKMLIKKSSGRQFLDGPPISPWNEFSKKNHVAQFPNPQKPPILKTSNRLHTSNSFFIRQTPFKTNPAKYF